jgi:autotransporter-associated beta strand protein
MVHRLQLLLKQDSGTLTLSGNNTYTGQTNINAGIISITDNNSLGSADGATIVADGASLSISNDITSAENITISGTGISSNGAIRNTADDNTLTGLITLAANSEIQIDSGSSLTLNPTSGNAITGTYNLTIESVGTSSINDPIATLNW